MNNDTLRHHVIRRPHQPSGWRFLLEAARDPARIGAIAPSSTSLARALIEPVHAHPGAPINVLEVGAGSGAVTRPLIAALSPGSRLDVVEANPRLAGRLEGLADHQGSLIDGELRIHAMPIERFGIRDLHSRYDVIVSTLPFTNFVPALVDSIMQRYLELLRPGGTLSYFAYLGTRRARALVASAADVDRHHGVEEILAGYRRQYGSGGATVWANLPPAKVWYLTEGVVA